MKISKLITLILSIFCLIQLQAQAPQTINYQAVVRDAGGVVVVNRSVTFRLSILTGGSTGTPQYIETHSAVTNAFGLVTLNIGGGTIVSGAMSSVTWATGSKFLRVEVDINGGSSYVVLGTTQFLSVPYALYAATSGNSAASGWGLTGNSTTTAQFIGTTNADDLRFHTEGSQKMVVKTSGYVGIGTPNPDSRLTIEGTSSADDRTFLSINNKATDFASQVSMRFTAGGGANATYLGHISPTYSAVGGFANFGQLTSNGNGLIMQAPYGILRFQTGIAPPNIGVYDRMTILNNGNVGIGTTSPTHRLRVETNSDETGAIDRLQIQLHNNSNSSEAFAGLGISSGNSGSKTWLEHLGSNYNVYSSAYSDFNDMGYMVSNGRNGFMNFVNNNDGKFRFAIGTGNFIPLTRMTLTSTGLGIGTQTPTNRLHIEGDEDGFGSSERVFLKLKNNSTSTAANVGQMLQSGTKGTFTVMSHHSSTYTVSENSDDMGQVWSSGKGLILRASPASASQDYLGSIRFYTGWNTASTFASNERMRVEANGNVGIGTTAPKAKLEVTNGDVYVNDATKGIILKSPNGNCWRVTMDNTGNFVRTAITCPN
jgi:hypothetical protein